MLKGMLVTKILGREFGRATGNRSIEIEVRVKNVQSIEIRS
jgi:hypothetical protein